MSNSAENSAEICGAINSPTALEYAVAISNDGLELLFTRTDQVMGGAVPFSTVLYRTTRAILSEKFASPTKIEALSSLGFIEAPSFSPDGKAIFFHEKENERFFIYRATR